MRASIGTAILVLLLAVPPAFATVCPVAGPITNDICDSAIPLGNNPQDVMLQGNTAMATHDYDIGHDNPCTGARSYGPDVVYSAVIDPECVLNVTLTLCDLVQWYDQSLYVVTDCFDLLVDCSGSDSPCIDTDCPPEAVAWSNTGGVPQTVYIVLDGKFPSSGGAWDMYVNTDCVVPVDASTWGTIKATYR